MIVTLAGTVTWAASLVERETTSEAERSPVRMTVRGAGTGETVRAEVENYRLSFAVVAPVKVKLARRACEAATAGKDETTAEAGEAEALRDWLSLVAPDCESLAPDQTKH